MGREHGYITIDDAGNVTAYRQVDPVTPISLTGGGGGGDLPDWWTVDSTPSSEKVTFDGQVRIDPSGSLTALIVEGTDTALIVSGDPDGDGYGLYANLGIIGSPLVEAWLTPAQEGANIPALGLGGSDYGRFFEVGPTGAVTISPSAAGTALSVEDFGATNPLLVIGESSGNAYMQAPESFYFVGTSEVGGVQLGDENGSPVVQVLDTQKLGFFNAAPVVKPTGVAATGPGVHAALVSLGLIAA